MCQLCLVNVELYPYFQSLLLEKYSDSETRGREHSVLFSLWMRKISYILFSLHKSISQNFFFIRFCKLRANRNLIQQAIEKQSIVSYYVPVRAIYYNFILSSPQRWEEMETKKKKKKKHWTSRRRPWTWKFLARGLETGIELLYFRCPLALISKFNFLLPVSSSLSLCEFVPSNT